MSTGRQPPPTWCARSSRESLWAAESEVPSVSVLHPLHHFDGMGVEASAEAGRRGGRATRGKEEEEEAVDNVEQLAHDGPNIPACVLAIWLRWPVRSSLPSEVKVCGHNERARVAQDGSEVQ
eukprot:764923-Hanusia_phi.AAC.12